MDRDSMGNLLFLTSLTALSLGCAQGSEGEGPRPGPFVASVGDPDPSDTWTDPIDSSGSEGSTSGGEGESSGGEGGWPSEGETGQVSSGGTTGVPPGDGGGVTTGPPPAAEESGDEGHYGSTGYDHPPAGGDPCPALAQLYADCNPDYIYDYEIDLCNEARAEAQSISAACGAAHAEYLACLSTLDCSTLLQPGVPLACAIQGAATDLACVL